MIADTLIVPAPSRLDASARLDFRSAALDCLDRVNANGGTSLVLDLADTEEVDACGLGLLVLLQKRARDRGLRTRLLHASEPVRAHLASARLEPLFQFDR